MTVATTGSGYLDRPRSSGLADVVDLILDKGLVIDAFVRVSVLGLELLTIDARIVIASVDTYLRFAEAVDRVVLGQATGKSLPDIVSGATPGAGAKKAVESGKDKVKDALGMGDSGEEQEEEQQESEQEQQQ